MRVMVADMKALVLLAYPLVEAGGMVQLYNLHNIATGVVATTPPVTSMQLFIGAMIYPLFLTAFFRLDGQNPLFRIATVIFISAVMGLVAFPVLTILATLVIPGLKATNLFLNLFVLVVDLAAAFGFLFALVETDLHKLSNRLIYGSLFALELGGVAFLLYYYEFWQRAWHGLQVMLGFAK